MSRSSSSGFLTRSVITVIITGALAGLLWWLFPTAATALWVGFRAAWLVIVVGIAIAILTLTLAAAERSGFAVLAGIATLAWFIFGSMGVPYAQEQAVAASVVIEDASPNSLSFRERSPFDVAKETSTRTLGDTTGNVTGEVKSLPTLGDHGMFSTSIIRKGWIQGYESTQMLTPPLFGTAKASDATSCDFSPNANLRFGGGWFTNSLPRAIAHQAGIGVSATQSDAFVVCDGDTPMLYAPLVKQVGLAITKRVPAGVAIYDGKTGVLHIEHEYEGNLPVYPQSLATMQRESTAATGSFADWLFGRAGYEDTGKDEKDPNGQNRAEFGLAEQVGETPASGYSHEYVTPLNPRGSSSSIIGIGTLTGSKMQTGVLNDFTVYRYPKDETRQANSAVADTITGTVLDGYKASGLTVFEIVPAANGNWVASIGKAQSILYRASIASDGNIAMLDADEPATEENTEKAGENAEAGKVELAKPIEQMSTQELRELGSQVLAELADRTGEQE